MKYKWRFGHSALSALTAILIFMNIAWSSTAHADTAWDFAGMYGYYSGGAYNNPATGSTSCPKGYTAYLVYGTPNVDWSMYFCGRPHVADQNSLYDFGGMFGLAGSTAYYAVPWKGYFYYVNPFTHTDTCPPGYTQTRVLGTPNVDNNLFYCWRAHSSDITTASMYFGGMTGDGATPYINPATQTALTCPSGYTAYPALGTPNVDYRFFYCGIPQNVATVAAGAGSLGIGEPIIEDAGSAGWAVSDQVNALNNNGINARVVRLWTLANDLLTSSTQINATEMPIAQATVQQLQSSGVTVLGVDGEYPTWMTGGTIWNEIPCRSTTPGSAYENFISNFKQSWNTMSAALPSILMWEPANETNGLLVPDLTDAGMCPAGHASTFTEQEAAAITMDMMYAAHAAIHANIPNATVFMPPPSPNPTGTYLDPTFAPIVSFITQIYSDIALGNWPSTNPRDYFDGGSWHPYIATDATASTWVEPNNKVYAVFQSNNDTNIPFLFSETGFEVCQTCTVTSYSTAASWMADEITLSQQNFPWLTYLIYFRAFEDGFGGAGANQYFGIMSSPTSLPGNTWFTTATSNSATSPPSGFCYFTGCNYPSPKP
ncbi:hypothetical protein ISP15_10250 [Dyella jejuensis]|uniref:Glycoside hydrolase family 5 domain-containing protein n=1 Tax=Dyella jejuensis TaxID=1432009 RepID=A0ABW8JHY4_9GAMM